MIIVNSPGRDQEAFSGGASGPPLPGTRELLPSRVPKIPRLIETGR